MSRRASLPGVDELFGGTPPKRQPQPAPAPTPEPTPPAPPTPAAPPAEAVTPSAPSPTPEERARATVGRLTAAENDAVRQVRQDASDLAVPIPEVGAKLAWLARSHAVRTAVEVGTAAGITGAWLLDALPDRGVLTSIELDQHTHELSRQTLRTLGAGTRVRSILGEALEVLPRLADAGYDLVLLQGERSRYPALLGHARRLLRPGGLLVARGILRADDHDDAVLRFVEMLVEDPAFDATALPLDDGLALATRLDTP